MRGKTGELLKDAEEVVAAQFRLERENTEPVVRLWMTVDPSNDSGDTRLCCRGAPPIWFAAPCESERTAN